MVTHDTKLSIYETGLDKDLANHVSLSPISFLRRSAEIYPAKTAIIYDSYQVSYENFYARCCKLAQALRKIGIGIGDTVAVMAPNVPAMLECHYGVPMTGAVQNTLGRSRVWISC